MEKTKDIDFSYFNVMDMHSTVMAVKFDKNCNSTFDFKDLSHVNLFRILMNCLSKEKNSILPNKIFYEDVNYDSIRPRKLSPKEIQVLRAK